MTADAIADTDELRRLRERREGLRSRMPKHSWRPVLVIVGVGAIDYGDRAILGVVLEDIKLEFGVGDTALGLLTAVYIILLTLSAIPFGLIADRWNRVKLIALGFIPWTIATIAQGLATSFGMLFGARAFLGSIESTNGPSAQSLLGDYYRVEQRSRVLGIWRIGDVLGAVIGIAVASVVAENLGWRAPFLVYGGLGILAALAVITLLREPPRGISDALHDTERQIDELEGRPVPEEATPTAEPDIEEALASGHGDDLTLVQAAREIFRIRTAWIMVIASGLGEFYFSGVGTWAITYFRRYFGMQETEAAAVLASSLVAVLLGAGIGSWLGDRLLRTHGRAARVRLTTIVYPIGGLAAMVAFSTDNLALTVAMFSVSGFSLYLAIPSLWAMWIDIIPAHLRGRAGGVFSVVKAGFIALGPALIGWLSDLTELRTAIVVVMPALIISGLLIGTARRSYPEDAERAARASRSIASSTP